MSDEKKADATLAPARLHIFPNYGRPHETDGAPCWCRTREELEGDTVLIIHEEPGN